MAADPISPIASARVRVLVLPAGRIKRTRFMTFVARLQHEPSVRLGDISPDASAGADSTMFSPMAFPNGALLYHYSTAMPPPSNLALAPYELFREPMMLIGIADAEEYHGENHRGSDAAIKAELEKVADHLKEQFPKILVRQLLIIDGPPDHSSDWVPEGAMCVPAQKDSRSTTMKTVMCDISAKFLAELSTYAKAVQALPSVQSPGLSSHTSQIPHRPFPDRSGSTASAPDTQSRNRSPSTVDHRSSSPSVNPPTSFDDMVSASIPGNALTRTASRTEKDGLRTASRDRMSMQAFGSSNAAEKARNKGKARVGIVIGNLYMLAGRWSDAWRELVENTNKARVASDYIWYAKGLESILVCMLLFVWAGFDFHIPAICYTGLDRLSSLSIPNGVKDGLPSLGSQDPVAAKDAAHRCAQLLPDLVNLIVTIHDRTSAPGAETVPPVAYSESIIRMSKLLAVLHTADGQLEPKTIGRMVSGKSLSRAHLKAGFAKSISKHSITDLLFRAYPSSSAVLPLTDATKVLAGIASVLSLLALERKKAMVIKELTASLVPALVQARKVGAAEMGIHPAASLSSAFDIPTGKHAGINGLLEEVHSIYGARDPDHPTTAEELHGEGEASIEGLVDAIVRSATDAADAQASGSLSLKIGILRACVDFCEALPDLAGIVYFAALLLRIAGPHSAVAPGTLNARVKLATEEQIRLISIMSRTSNAASKIGLRETLVPYWDDFLVRNVQWIEEPSLDKLRELRQPDSTAKVKAKRRTPFLYDPSEKNEMKEPEKIIVAEEPAKVLLTLQNPYDFEVRVEKLQLTTDGPVIKVHHIPFILGPNRLQSVPISVEAKEVGKAIILGCSIQIAGCREQMFPIYRDAWSAEVPIKIKELGLFGPPEAITAAHPASTDGVRSATPPARTTLSCTVIQPQPHVLVDSTSLSESALMVLEGQKRVFQVTLNNPSPTRSVDFLHFSFEDSLTTSMKAALLDKDLSRADMYELELELAEDPIFIWARADSKPVGSIEPGEKVTYDITVVGRPGLGAARIMFDYAYLGQPVSEVKGSIYTRQVVVPVDITVNASVQLHRIDFTEFPSEFAWSNQHRLRLEGKNEKRFSRLLPTKPVEKSNDRFRSLLERVGLSSASDSEEHCLVLLDLRNAWPNPLTVSVEVRESLGSATSSPSRETDGRSDIADGWKRAYTVHEVVHPGHIARLVLLLPKLQVLDPHAPIPLLSPNQRQYVVNADKVFSQNAEMTHREQFWFREEVLKYIRGSWKEDGTARQGTVDLRGIRLSPRMIDMLRLQDVDVTMTVVAATSQNSSSSEGIDSADNDDPVAAETPITRLGQSEFQVLTESFLTLRAEITNRSPIPVRGILRLQPSWAHQASTEHIPDIGRKLIISGLLQQVLPTISPRETVTVEVGLCPVVGGEFDIHALVEELVIPPHYEHVAAAINAEERAITSQSNDTHEDFSVSGQGLRPRDRRIWRAGEACKLFAVDAEG
ncbi:hypothetical protein AAFC00_005155 [Neodothiora populina]|uniref:Hypercellular protein HypA n=1 Tax=Neodothiora populina TaxID=2781224 RepID=A0ABR3PK76_9PEZI